MRKWKGFADRREAGRWLAKVTRALNLDNPVVLALPRGGVPVAFEVAKALGAPMDVLLVHKISAPGQEEYGIGAVIDGASPQVIIDAIAARLTGADQAYIDQQVTQQLAEIERRRVLYCTHAPVSLVGRASQNRAIAVQSRPPATPRARPRAAPRSPVPAPVHRAPATGRRRFAYNWQWR